MVLVRQKDPPGPSATGLTISAACSRCDADFQLVLILVLDPLRNISSYWILSHASTQKPRTRTRTRARAQGRVFRSRPRQRLYPVHMANTTMANRASFNPNAKLCG